MTNRQFAKGYYGFLKVIQTNGGAPCSDSPDIFFPEDIPNPEERAAGIARALAICESCPILEQCYEYAITSNQRFGIWGGTLASER